METAVLPPQHANPIQATGTRSLAGTQARNAAAMAATRKLPAARRKTLCDITNLRQPLAAAAAEEGPRCADGAEAVARLVRENSDLVRLLEEREYVYLPESPRFLHRLLSVSFATVSQIRLGFLVRGAFRF
jgi:hypothetical protein